MKKKTPKRHFWRNFRFRIILALVLIGLIPFPLLFIFTIRSYESKMADKYLSSIKSSAHVLADRMAGDYYWTRQSSELTGMLSQFGNQYGGRAVVVDYSYTVIADSFGEYNDKTIVMRDINRAFSGRESGSYDRDGHFMRAAVPIYGTDGESVMAVLWTGVPTTFIDLIRNDTYDTAVMMLIATLIVIALLTYLLSFLLIRPWRRLGKTMNDISKGARDEELNIRTYNETTDISESFNMLKNRHEVLDRSRSEFVANVSHELKTPITAMKVLADSLVEMQDVPPELYQEFMRDIGGQLDRETAIIDDLLALVKLDKRSAVLRISEVNVNEMLENLIKQLGPLANVKDVSITLESHRSVTASIDEVKLSLACMNILENAIKYNNPGGSINVSLDAEEEHCVITISDTGPGIPAEDLAKVFERFYRVDKSHSGQMSGSGLGLAIARQSVEIQGGTIAIDSTEGVGTSVTIRVPLVVDSSSLESAGDKP